MGWVGTYTCPRCGAKTKLYDGSEVRCNNCKIATCEATGEDVLMVKSKGYTSANGHDGWLCLHEEEVEMIK